MQKLVESRSDRTHGCDLGSLKSTHPIVTSARLEKIVNVTELASTPKALTTNPYAYIGSNSKSI